MRSSLWEISPGGGHTKSQSLFLFAQDQQELGPLSSLTPQQPCESHLTLHPHETLQSVATMGGT